MAEAIALGASVVAIIQIADRIAGLCKRYIQATRDAPSDLRYILLEISTLKAIFQNVKFLTSENKNESKIISALSEENGPIESCHRSMVELEKLLHTDFSHTSNRYATRKHKRQAIIAALQWPLKENKAKKLMEELSRFKTTIILALTTESIEDIKEIKAKASKIHIILEDSQRRDVYRWLKHTDPSDLHYRAQKNYEPGTCDWVTSVPQWTDWMSLRLRCLWVHGIPGAGKTVLASHLIDNIAVHCENTPGQGVTYVYYYCYFGRTQDEAKPFLQWLLKRLCQEMEIVPASLYRLFKRDSSPSLTELLTVLEEVLNHCEILFLVIDAIDESESRQDLLEILGHLVTDTRFRKIQLLVTSREYVDIEKTMKGISTDLPMDNDLVAEDIRRYVRSALSSNYKFRHWPQDVLKEAEDALATNAKGMFRWAVCQIDVLQRLKCDRHIIKNELTNLPRTLYDVYSRIWSMIQEDERMFVFHILQWLIHQDETHTRDKISCGVILQGVERSMALVQGHPNSRSYDADVLKELCGCLIHIDMPPTHLDLAPSSVSFAHYTVREFLDSKQFTDALGAPTPYFTGSPRSCITELVFTEVLHIESRESWMKSWTISFHQNFTKYCILSVLKSLSGSSRNRRDRILADNTLCNLAVDILNPSKPHYEALATMAEHNNIKYTYQTDVENLWSIKWDAACRNTTAAHFLNLILFSCANNLSLVQKYLQASKCKELFSTRLKIKISLVLWAFGTSNKPHTIEGFLIEVVAQTTLYRGDDFGWLLDVGLGQFDPTKILLLFIGSHINTECEDYTSECPIEKLLRLGANPDTAGNRVTPLQIATEQGDVKGVKALLEAGAAANTTGDENGIAWQDNTPMSRFNDLCGRSPLEICESRMRDWTINNICIDNICMEIKTILLQHGARSPSSVEK